MSDFRYINIYAVEIRAAIGGGLTQWIWSWKQYRLEPAPGIVLCDEGRFSPKRSDPLCEPTQFAATS